MSGPIRVALWVGLGLASSAFAQSELLTKARALELEGNFKQAAAALVDTLNNRKMAETERKTVEFELDRLERIRKDFPYTKEALFADLRKSVRELTREEFEQWVAAGRFDSREIDGQRFYMGSSLSNLYFRYPELVSRRMDAKDPAPLQRAMWETCAAIKEAARAEQRPYVLPKRLHISMSVATVPGAAPAGETIRAWLPIPRRYPFQDGFELTSASSAIKHLDDEQSPIRSLYLEQPAKKNKGTVFKIEYDFTTRGVWFELRPDTIRPGVPADPSVGEFLKEAPHVVFSPQIRELSEQIAGAEQNPCLKAKKFYDWIAGNIKYSYAIEYSTIRNISEYCRARGYGDCGQEALLFITLCRLNGIPARWQSGWNLFPGATTIHDWTEIYLEPYGWVPVDPYMGIHATQYATKLTPAQRRELRDFYFGGLDQFRMAANSDHNQQLTPAKTSMRSDTVDFQRGELECDGKNIYFDKYKYELKWKEIKNPAADARARE